MTAATYEWEGEEPKHLCDRIPAKEKHLLLSRYIWVLERLIEVRVMHTMVMPEGDARRENVGEIAEKEGDEIEGLRGEYGVVGSVVNEHPERVVGHSTDSVDADGDLPPGRGAEKIRQRCHDADAQEHVEEGRGVRLRIFANLGMGGNDCLFALPMVLQVLDASKRGLWRVVRVLDRNILLDDVRRREGRLLQRCSGSRRHLSL